MERVEAKGCLRGSVHSQSRVPETVIDNAHRLFPRVRKMMVFLAIAEAKRKTPEVFPSPRVRFGGAERGIMPEISQASNQLHAVQTTCRNR